MSLSEQKVFNVCGWPDASPHIAVSRLRNARISARQLRLFACGVVRQSWDLLDNTELRLVVITAEAFADGRATDAELARAFAIAPALANLSHHHPHFALYHDAKYCGQADAGTAASHASLTLHSAPTKTIWEVLDCVFGDLKNPVIPTGTPLALDREGMLRPAREGEVVVARAVRDGPVDGHLTAALTYAGNVLAPQAGVLRVPARKPVPKSVLDYSGRLPVRLAGAMYESRDFSGMPQLGDVLEEAGLGNEEMLNHCRSAKVHVRGCFACDRILGLE